MDARILQEFRAITGDRGLITSQEELKTYECDGLTNFRVVPQAVLLPRSTEQVQGSCVCAIESGFRLWRAVQARD